MLKKTLFLVILFTQFCFSLNCNKADIYIIHGTFAANFAWHKRGGVFYESIKSASNEHFGEDNYNLIDFIWSGYIGTTSWIEGAVKLAKQIAHSQNKTYIAAHSHGGTVAIIASIILEMATSLETKEAKLEKIQVLANILLKKLEEEDEKWKRLTRNKANVFQANRLAEINKIILSCVEDLRTNLSLHQPSRTQENENKQSKSFFIEELFLLATPISENILPSNKSIKKVFNLYSKLDFIQTVFGIYEKFFVSSLLDVINISVAFCKIGPSTNYIFPSHSSLHSPILGKYLFQLSNLTNSLINSSSKLNKKIKMIFYEDFKKPILTGGFTIHSSVFEIWISNIKDLLSFL